MKYKLIIVISFITLNIFSQKVDLKNVPKKTSKIIINNENLMKDNLTVVVELLLDNDYSIDKIDKEFGTIKTDLQPIKGLNGSYFFNIRVKDYKIIVTGKFIVNLSLDFGNVESQPSLSEIVNKGMKGSAIKKSFEYMYLFSQQLPLSEIIYEN